MSDYKGAAILLGSLPEAKELLADRGYDATWFRIALLNRGITLCIPSKKNRNQPVSYDKNLYKQKHKTEIIRSTQGLAQDCHAYDRCAHTFFSALCLACTVIFYLN